MPQAPNNVVKKTQKRPSQTRLKRSAESEVVDLAWIAHLHQLWAIPRTARTSLRMSA